MEAVHIAYALAAGQDLENHSLWLLHVHRPDRLHALLKIVPEFEKAKILISFRSPFFVLSSEYRAQMLKQPEFSLSKRYAWKYGRTWMTLDHLRDFRVAVLSLHELHADPSRMTQALAEELEIAWAANLIESTWLSLEWWGDSQSDVLDESGRRGFNAERHTLQKRCPAGLTERLVMESLYYQRLTMMGVPMLWVARCLPTRVVLLALLPILAIVPTRLERTLLIYEIERSTSFSRRLVAIAIAAVSLASRYVQVLSAWLQPGSRHSVRHHAVHSTTLSLMS